MGVGGSIPAPEGMHLVIIGGGYGGSTLAVQLLKSNFCKITLIDPKEAMLHSMGALRTVVDESYANKLLIPYDRMLGDSFVKGKVVSINTTQKEVCLENDKKISYTHLVIATGSTSPFPSKLGENAGAASSIKEITQLYADFRQEVRPAKRVVLVGGGAVGVEMAGELKHEFPDKEVTIISSSDFLVSKRTPAKFQKSLAKAISNKGITVLTKERVSNLSDLSLNKHEQDQVVTTESGKEIKADLIIPCTGTKLNNDFFKDMLPVNQHGALQVDEFLRVKGHEHVYAIGDINDVAEEKQAYTAKLQVDVLIANLKSSAKVGNPKKPYKPSDIGMVVPVGRGGGVGIFKGMLLGNFPVRNLKGKDLMAGQMWKDLGLKVPH